MSVYAYIGKGTISVKEYGSADPLRELGNASSLVLGTTEQTIDLLDFQNAGGGKDESLRRIEAVTVQMTLHNLDPQNLAMALFGTTSSAAGVATIEALVTSGKEWVVSFDGLNEAKSDRNVDVTLHRVRFGPAANFGLITNEYAGLEMTGEALRDDAIVTAGLSKYFKIVMAEAV